MSETESALAGAEAETGLCFGLIDLSKPETSERVRSFQPPYITVWIYKCPRCGATRRVRAGSFRGKKPVPSVGGMRCGAPR